MNNSVEGFKGRLDQEEERISDLEDASIELSNLRGKKKKNGKEWRKPTGLMGHD